MAAKKQDLSNQLLDAVLGGVTYTPPASVFAALYSVAPTDTTAGTEISATGTDYVRMPVTFGVAVNGESSNTAAVTWPIATAAYDPVVAVALCESDVVDTDDQLYVGVLDMAATIAIGDEANFAVGALVVTEE